MGKRKKRGKKLIHKIGEAIEGLIEFIFGFIAIILILSAFGIDSEIINNIAMTLANLPIIGFFVDLVTWFISLLGNLGAAGFGGLIIAIIVARRILD